LSRGTFTMRETSKCTVASRHSQPLRGSPGAQGQTLIPDFASPAAMSEEDEELDEDEEDFEDEDEEEIEE